MNDKPQVGDRVRYTVEGTVTCLDEDGYYLGADGWYPSDKGKIETIGRADDPAKDPVGTVRKGGHHRETRYVKVAQDTWHAIADTPARTCYYWDSQMERSEVVGTIPGTPAADAEREPRVFHPGFGGDVPKDITLESAAGRFTFQYKRGYTNPLTGAFLGDVWVRFENGEYVGYVVEDIEWYVGMYGPLTEVL